MTDQQWSMLLRILDGEQLDPLPVGFIIDSPWLPNWAGMSILDYFTSDPKFLEANFRAIDQFPDVLFLPGFWSEYGMCTEPSAFGAKCVFPEDEFPFADKVLSDYDAIARLAKPNCRKDGLLPFIIKRLSHCQTAMEEAGHKVRFAVARGPLNIASFLLGHTEFLMGVRTDPEPTHKLLKCVSDFLVDWVQYQAERFPSIDGILLLDDLVGFLGDADFQEFAVPYLKQVFGCLDVRVKAFHNDARGMITAKYLEEIGVNLFNFSFEHPISEVRAAAGESVTMLGNIPPRDVLASGTPDDVRQAVAAMLEPLSDRRRLILSCGGGMPPGTPAANLEAFCEAARAAG